jgi:nitroimidazol reductase NimA-like FMN-containing flavoprotein (pyridoxamine 5'-phosphate oxidase superfamily)
MTADTDTFAIDDRNRVKRLNKRAHYDRATIYPILDTALLCHIAYVVDGQPYCTPTGFWREGDTLFWHGSSASRMLRTQAAGVPVCLTVTHMDGLVMARSGFNHSINYRSVMAFGVSRFIDDAADKRRAMDAFVERFFPGRNALLREPTVQEVKATAIMSMEIEQASAKIRATGPGDDEADFAWPVWAGVIPLRTVIGAEQDCPRLPAGLARGEDLAAYQPCRVVDEAFLDMHRREYGGG